MRWNALVRHGLISTSLLGAAAGHARAERCDDVAERTITFVIGADIGEPLRLVGGVEFRECLNVRSEMMVRVELGGGPVRLIGGARIRPFENDGRNGYDGGGELV